MNIKDAMILDMCSPTMTNAQAAQEAWAKAASYDAKGDKAAKEGNERHVKFFRSAALHAANAAVLYESKNPNATAWFA